MLEKSEILKIINTCKDPELKIGIVDLGLIYAVTVNEKNDVQVTMTVTTPGCPVIPQFIEQVHERLSMLEGIGDIDVQLTFTPPWTPDKMKPEIRATLGI